MLANHAKIARWMLKMVCCMSVSKKGTDGFALLLHTHPGLGSTPIPLNTHERWQRSFEVLSRHTNTPPAHAPEH